ncbi:MAG: CDP-alcohol phosphatidyltransferase family protein [Steroidobacteraceae bacterium]
MAVAPVVLARSVGLHLAAAIALVAATATLAVPLLQLPAQAALLAPMCFALGALALRPALRPLLATAAAGAGGRFGAANRITLLRAVLVAWLAGLAAVRAPVTPTIAWSAVLVALFALALDGVDGRIARRRGLASEFGARFDMETDALFVLVLSVLAFAWQRAGAWVLLSGLMRYAFVAAGALWPWLAAPLAQSRRRQAICVVQLAGLVIALVPVVPVPLARTSAALALLALAGSFLADVVLLAGERARARAAAVVEAATLLLALFALNALLSFHNHWPTPAIELHGELALEAALLVLGLAALIRTRGQAPAPWRWAFAALLLLGALARYAEVTAPALYGRAVNLYWDARHVGNVVAMLARSAPPWAAGLAALAVAALLALGLLASEAIVARIARALARDASPLLRRSLVALAVLWCAGFVANRGFDAAGPLHYSIPVAQTWGTQLARLVGSWREAHDPRRELRGAPPPALALDGLQGADVLLVFVESYGRVALEHPVIARRIAASRERFAQAIAASGREVVSASVESPTFGGGSWLAHASLMSGFEVRDDDAVQRLAMQPHATLVDRFRSAGYRTVALMPGLHGEWPEGGVLYGFDAVHGAPQLDWRGPEFGWWKIPDQFSLARFDALEAAATAAAGGRRRPRFVMFPTISSHMPFRPTPPYQPDWTRMTGARPYGREAEAALAGGPDWNDLAPAYAGALAYTLDTLAGYLLRHAGEPLVMIVIGDHQPPAVVSGEGADWLVPVHVIADHAAPLAALRAAGFAAGPQAPARRLAAMHELTPLLLRALAGDGAAAGATVGAAVARTAVAGAGRPVEIGAPRVDITRAAAAGPEAQPLAQLRRVDPLAGEQRVALAERGVELVVAEGEQPLDAGEREFRLAREELERQGAQRPSSPPSTSASALRRRSSRSRARRGARSAPRAW